MIKNILTNCQKSCKISPVNKNPESYHIVEQMAKDLNVTILLDVYGQLLTEKQRNAIDMYYNEDLSLSEIADVIDISRQGVRESIKQGEKHLTNYEEKLGIVERFHNISSKLEKLNALLENTDFDGKDEFYGLIDEISKEI